MGAAFGMSGPTLSGSKRDESKGEERVHATEQAVAGINPKVLGSKKATKFLGSTLPGSVKAPGEGAAFGMR